jgi:hypothetical protein
MFATLLFGAVRPYVTVSESSYSITQKEYYI